MGAKERKDGPRVVPDAALRSTPMAVSFGAGAVAGMSVDIVSGRISLPTTTATTARARARAHAPPVGAHPPATSPPQALFPIDTVKTRMQAPQGFFGAGGFRGIYNGLGATAIGSAPGAALFFGAYNGTKDVLSARGFSDSPAVHMAAASIGEVVACAVRVPTENVKQKQQTGMYGAEPPPRHSPDRRVRPT